MRNTRNLGRFHCFRTFQTIKYTNIICGSGLVAKSCPTLATPWTVACQAPLSMGFSRQEYWSGLLFSSPGNQHNMQFFPNLFCSRFFFLRKYLTVLMLQGTELSKYSDLPHLHTTLFTIGSHRWYNLLLHLETEFTSFSQPVLVNPRSSVTLVVKLEMESFFPFLVLLCQSSNSDKLDFDIFEGVFFLSFFPIVLAFSLSFLCSCCCIVSFLFPFCFSNVDFPWRFCLANKLWTPNTPWVI